MVAKKTVTAGKRLTTAKNDTGAAVKKWAIEGGLVVRRRKELWVRSANGLAVLLAVCGFFRWGLPATTWGLPFAAFFLFSRRAWSAGVGTRRTAAGRELWSRQADSTDCSRPTRPRRVSTSPPARTSTPPTSRSPSQAVAATELSAKKYQDTVGAVAPQGRIGTIHRLSSTGRGFGGQLQWTELRTASNRLCRRRSAPTPPPSRRHRRREVAVAVAGAAAEAAGEEAARGDLPYWSWSSYCWCLVLLGFVLGYNKIRSADVRVSEALSGIDIKLTRHASLIPSLVHTVQTLAASQKGVLDHVTDARAALTSATAGTSVAQRSAAERGLNKRARTAFSRLDRRYPQLNSSSNFLNLPEQLLTDAQNKVAFARQYYNDAVATLNKSVTTIPWMFVAPLARVSPT